MNATPKRRPTRREFVGLLGGGATSLLGLRLLSRPFTDGTGSLAAGGGTFQPHALDSRAIRAAVPSSRALVVIELSGGNDGLSTLVPYGDPAYRTLRKNTAIEAEKVHRLDATFGLHPNLGLTASRLAVVQGVGANDPNGSHFEMSARWWAGDESGKAGLATGFLGRLCDVLDDGAPVTGVSLAGASPAILSDKAVTVGLPNMGDLQWLLADDPWSANLRRGLGDLAASANGDAVATQAARRGLTRALAFGPLLKDIQPADGAKPATYPGSALGDRLRSAATLLGAGAGVRVIHVQQGGYDTHSNQRGNHDGLMQELDQALAAFADDLEARGLTESVLVATTSEFGRRPKESESGTDHGTASCALLLGPVKPGLHGEPPSLAALDPSDNLRATVTLEQYYATLAQSWFGIDANAILPSKPKPIDGVLNV